MDVEAVDVDSDGDLDLIIATEYGRNLLFFNNGSGTFTEDQDRIFPEWNIFNQPTIDIEEYSSEVNLYPNPVSDQFTVKGNSSLQGADYQVYNNQGALVDSNQTATSTFQVDSSSWAVGTYTIIINLRDKSYALNFDVVK